MILKSPRFVPFVANLTQFANNAEIPVSCTNGQEHFLDVVFIQKQSIEQGINVLCKQHAINKIIKQAGTVSSLHLLTQLYKLTTKFKLAIQLWDQISCEWNQSQPTYYCVAS